MPGKPRFAITVESMPSDVAVQHRLRAALKALGRLYGLRAVEVREVPAGGEKAAQRDSGGPANGRVGVDAE